MEHYKNTTSVERFISFQDTISTLASEILPDSVKIPQDIVEFSANTLNEIYRKYADTLGDKGYYDHQAALGALSGSWQALRVMYDQSPQWLWPHDFELAAVIESCRGYEQASDNAADNSRLSAEYAVRSLYCLSSEYDSRDITDVYRAIYPEDHSRQS